MDILILASGDALVDPGRKVQFPQLQLSRQDTSTDRTVNSIPSDLKVSLEDQEHDRIWKIIITHLRSCCFDVKVSCLIIGCFATVLYL